MKIYTYVFLFIVSVSGEISAQSVFTKQVSPVTTGYKAVHFDSNVGYACGENGVVVKTNNDGGEWITLATGTIQPLWDIKVLPGTAGKSVIAVGENNTIIKSTDGGMNWYSQTVPFQSGSFVFGIQCFDSLHYVACGGDFATYSGAILSTKDGGITWTKTAVLGSVFLDKIFMTSDSAGYVVGTNNTFSDGSIKKITKSLTTSHSLGTSQLLTNLYMLNNQHIIAVGLSGQIMVSVDNGISWVNKSIHSVDLYAIHFLNQHVGFVAGGNSAGNSLLKTVDSGVTWTKVETGFSEIIQSVFASGKYLFLVGEAGLILRAEHGVQTGLFDLNSRGDDFDLSYNPVQKQIVFTTTKSAQISYKIYDSQGKVMISGNTLENTNVSMMHSNNGMYLIEFSDGTMKKFEKIIIF